MTNTRGRVRIFYADGTTHDVQMLGVDRLRAEREKAKAGEEEQVWYRAYLAAERAGVPGVGAGFDAWMSEIVDIDPLMTEEQIDSAYAAGQITEDQAEAARQLLVTEEPGESPAALHLSPASPYEPARMSEVSST